MGIIINKIKNARKEIQSHKESPSRQKKKKNRIILSLHLQSPQASSREDRYLQEIHEHHELIHQRCLRENLKRSRQTRQIQQETHSLIQRSSNRCQTPPPGRARQACRCRRNQGCHQVLKQLKQLICELENVMIYSTYFITLMVKCKSKFPPT